MKNTQPKISVCIPAYNESKTIKRVIEEVLQLKYQGELIVGELIVYNDCSKDNTYEIAHKISLKDSRVRVFSNEKNMGKTQTVKRAITHTTGDIVVVQDADLELEPTDLVKMYEKYIKTEGLRVIYGNRFNEMTKNKGKNYRGNLFLTAVSNALTASKGFKVKDMEVCYKMTDGDLYRAIGKTIESNSLFGLEPEMTAKFARSGAKPYNIDINFYPRTAAEGKHMKAVRDGLKAVVELLKYNLFSTFEYDAKNASRGQNNQIVSSNA